MEYRFKADVWNTLTSEQRVHRCRLWAPEAQRLADMAAPDRKARYQSIADQWRQLAIEMP